MFCQIPKTIVWQLLCLLAFTSSFGCSNSDTEVEPPVVEDESKVQEEIVAWKNDRHERLQRADGWLSLVGLSWLESGANSVGSAEDSRVRLPASAPERTGTLHLDGQTVRFEAEPEVTATIGGISTTDEGAAAPELVTDADGEPTLVEIGSVSFHIIVRQDRYGVRIKDSQAPTLLEFEGMESFPVDLAWRLSAQLKPYDPPQPISIPNILGTASAQESPGALEFSIDGQTQSIDALPGGDDGSFFLVFGDTTNGKETYGGGRFLYTSPPDEKGRVTVDFNQAYNPPCVFTPYATCPLPPPQNKLKIAIPAGEKSYAHAAH